MCCLFDTATRKHRFLTAKTDPTYLTTVFKSEEIDLVKKPSGGPVSNEKPTKMMRSNSPAWLPEHRQFRSLVKLTVIAWTMLPDEKVWDTQHMISVTESYGRMPVILKESLTNMKPKENSAHRNARHRREAHEARHVALKNVPHRRKE
jgi:hypothetical protein